MVPRCGNRDIGNDTSFTQHSANHGDLQSVARYEIFEGRPRWKKRALTFAFLPQNKLPDNYKKTIARGLSKWQAVTPLSFREPGSYSKADIKIGFYSKEHGCRHTFDGVLRELAHAYAPPFGWFHFDNNENWVVHQGDQPGHDSKGPTMLTAIDLESVAIHEIGHDLLGLGHSVDRNAIMFPTLAYGVRKTELQKDNVDGIQSLYGANPDSSKSSPSSHAQNLFRGTPAGSRWDLVGHALARSDAQMLNRILCWHNARYRDPKDGNSNMNNLQRSNHVPNIHLD
ncbi:hypothetical protein QYF36_012028 [Acer negundo]|nr:hypothetical protein QYF36_012028 [Acer negundo]